MVVPKSSFTSPMKSISVRSAPRFARQRQFAARNLDRDRHKILGAVQLEVIHFHRDGQVGDRVAQHQRVFELPFLIGGGELVERLAGEVTLAEIELALSPLFSVILMRRNLPSRVWLVV